MRRRRLLSEPDLTLKQATEVAQSMEAAERNTQQLKGGEASVNSIESATVSDRKGEKCYRCGSRNHSYRECRFKDAECHNCVQKGHIARMCCSKRAVANYKGRGPKKQLSGGRQKTQWVQADRDSESAEDSDFVVYRIRDCAAHPITAQLGINGKQLTMEVDTGAAVSIISESTQKKVLWGIKDWDQCFCDTILCILYATQ